MTTQKVLVLLCLYATTNIFTSTEKTIHTYSGGVCFSPCNNENREHYWCYSHGGDLAVWDYCSPMSQVDYDGKFCSGDCHEGLVYTHWCNLENGGWSLCSVVSGC